ncbi:potassium transporter Kup [Prosthecomicrobium hirschii]|uniref:potassium transporter Kup n=1 Tax=Prosthecodimorpha hirschii TaxID=665126 RepID=UPI00222019CE|nr:potassium transporter Kup [Prosthecomicrobium hirschii]MCW1843545.1 potassium transporter Kup [Prosthecomicrobium hirschii]
MTGTEPSELDQTVRKDQDTAATTAPPAEPAEEHHGGLLALSLGSIGVVYGDIGTSPLYALRESLVHSAKDGLTRSEVLGVVSLLLWALVIIVTIKYVILLMRADNKGEGGILSLLALAQGAVGRQSVLLMVLAALGASLFYGDSIITPAISVLSAVEGLKLVTPVFEPYVVPITVVILVGLFAIQPRGTGAVAVFFGPITAVWFLAMAASGLSHISDDPGIFLAFNPVYAIEFLLHEGVVGFVVLGSVFLAVTGAEALYADMGHFGRKPIQLAWISLVFPSLALNYLGQGALVLAHPEAIENPFFLLVPSWALLPYVLLATVATVIASQAVISGAFSVTRQAVLLGLLPRFEVRHTSETQRGQIYMPRVNWMQLAGVLVLVLMFRSSSALASAYGIAVTGDMVITSCLAFIVLWRVWGWGLPAAALVVAPFLAVELTFLAANLLKLFDGAWLPLCLSAFLVTSMWTWVRGTQIVFDKSRRDSVPLATVMRSLEKSKPFRPPGTAVFLTSDPDTAPPALLHNLKHNRVLHGKNVILTVRTATTPKVAEENRIALEPVNEDFTRLFVNYGYMEEPNIPKALGQCRKLGLKFDIMSTTFFVARRTFRVSANSGMPLWQDRLFIAMSKDAANATDFYSIPTGRVVELGQQITV